VNAFAFVAMDAYQGEVAHRFEEDRDGTDILAEGSVVLEQDGQQDAHHVIGQVADEEQYEHGVFGGFPVMEQQEDENQRQREHDITDEAEFLSRTLGLLVRQQVENHGRPAGIAAPAATEEQRPENLGDSIVQHASTHHAREEIIPEALNLHILPADEAEKDEHVDAHAKLDELASVFPSSLR